jgi:glycosyltransferase involved in cell wall biosynthesis
MIPTYNQSTFILDAIESALAQNYSNLEIIVGDDASTDATSEIVSKISDRRLKYFLNEINLGRVGNYKNLLYQHATGDYVVNLDGDDYFTDPNFIDEAVKLITSNQNIVMVVAKASMKTAIEEIPSLLPKTRESTGLKILSEIPRREYMMMHMAVLYSRKKAIEIDFYRANEISSDWESLYRLILHGNVGYLDRNIGVWRIHANNETNTTNPIKHLNNLGIWGAIYQNAILNGMNSFYAKYKCLLCMVFFAQSTCTVVSKKNNLAVMNFLMLILRDYKSVAIFLIVNPFFWVRFMLCLTGYYRKNIASKTY